MKHVGISCQATSNCQPLLQAHEANDSMSDQQGCHDELLNASTSADLALLKMCDDVASALPGCVMGDWAMHLSL